MRTNKLEGLLKRPKYVPFDSLRSRFLFATIFLTLIFFSLIYFSHAMNKSSQEIVASNVATRSQLLSTSRQVREYLMSAYASMDLFLLEPEKQENVDNMYIQVDLAEDKVKHLHGFEQAGAELNGLFKSIPLQIEKIETSLDKLVKTRRDPFLQFPSLGLSNEKMQPNRDAFNNAIAICLLESKDRANNVNDKAYSLLLDIRHYWTQMVSNFRSYMVNRLGSYDLKAFNDQEEGIRTFYEILQQYLNQLKAMDKQSQLGFETSNLLPQLINSSHNWYAGFEKVVKIHQNDDWRSDRTIIAERVEPQFTKLWELLHRFDKAVEDASINDIHRVTKTANYQENLFWIFLVGSFLFFLVSVIYAEKLIFGPIARITSALRDEASGREGIILPTPSTRETRELIDAFFDMKVQIRNRQQALEHKSFHDELTGLPNRNLMFDRIQQSIMTARHNDATLSVMVINISNLKEINDTLGHHIGDMLLIELTSRLEHCIYGFVSLSKLGGSEFAVLASGMGKSEAEEFAATLLGEMKNPIILDDIEVHPKFNIGISQYPLHGKDKISLIQRADMAMLYGKKYHQEIAVFDESREFFNVNSMGLLSDLKDAIKHNSLEMYYQPKFDIEKGIIVGVEALLRWHHKKYGRMQASEVIELAERSGLVESLTRWTIDEVFRQCGQWNNIGLQLNVAINLSVQVLQDDVITNYVKQALDQYKISPESVTLEITESAMMTNPVKVSMVLEELHEIGVSISADDFGTGFSSLSYLKKLPVTEIKIDKSFIIDMVGNATDMTIVKSAIGLAHNLGLKVVAEGIENTHTKTALQELACDIGQGYYYSRPLNAEALTRLASVT